MSLKRQILRKIERALVDNDLETVKSLQPVLSKILIKPDNLILLSDGYKYSHPKFYTNKMTKLVSYMESRGGKFSSILFNGLQDMIVNYLEGVAITKEEVDEAYETLGGELGIFGRDDVFDRSKFDYIVEKHGGKLPISIKAVPEGTVLETKNVLLMIESLDENCAWLVNFLESLILQIWYPITVGSLSRKVRSVITDAFLKSTNYDIDIINIMVDYVLNDFGFRGVSSVESAKIGGIAHLIMFSGSDNVAANNRIKYSFNTDKNYAASIPATEHSITTLRGEKGELDVFKHVLKTFPTGLVACVSDSYDIIRAVEKYWGTELIDLILSRPSEPGNQLIIRPDSGHVIKTLEKIFEVLFDKFGYTVNEKGYKVLPPQIRVIQGDGVNLDSIIEIYEFLDSKNISPENIALGMGGKLLQADINRDTNNFAIKVCYAIVDGEEVDVQKSPTELDKDGNYQKSSKKSKKGLMKLVKTETGFTTLISEDEGYDEAKDELVEVFRMGVLTKRYTFDEIRERAKIK